MIIDTSVLLYDPDSLKSFEGNDIVLPLVVLEELDRFKERQDLVGNNARRVNRFLDELRTHGSLSNGVKLPNHDVVISVAKDPLTCNIPKEFDPKTGDNKILSVALAIHMNGHDKKKIVKVITKDINLRVKCDALGIPSEDYYRDLPKCVREGSPIYSGQSSIFLPEEDIDEYYLKGYVNLSKKDLEEDFIQNQLIVATTHDHGKSMIAMVKNNKLIKPQNKLNSLVRVEPRSKEQRAAIHLLTDLDLPLVSVTGIAGSGKTFLALVAGMSGIQEKIFDRIIITRSIEPVGRDMGFLPGDLEEKMAPWLMPILDNFRNAFHDPTWFQVMKSKGIIEVSPIAYIRGRSFNKSFVIVDECQNLTIHELKTIITRCGEGTKMVLLGDTDQVDTPYMDKYSNGLRIAIEKLKGQKLFGHIHLDKGERSPLATLGSNVL